jgi:hypothetical protein
VTRTGVQSAVRIAAVVNGAAQAVMIGKQEEAQQQAAA